MAGDRITPAGRGSTLSRCSLVVACPPHVGAELRLVFPSAAQCTRCRARVEHERLSIYFDNNHSDPPRYLWHLHSPLRVLRNRCPPRACEQCQRISVRHGARVSILAILTVVFRV